jgi:uncharacterized membrane protein YphA (DoxX/SURF4 family)
VTRSPSNSNDLEGSDEKDGCNLKLRAIAQTGLGTNPELGFLTRLAALGLAFDMISAIVFVKLKGGFFVPAR